MQTYAHLRARQRGALPIPAGVVLYVNELRPSVEDLEDLRREMRERITDVAPPEGSELWTRIAKNEVDFDGDGYPVLPLGFRLRRAIRIVPVTGESIERSLDEFDRVVRQIETCRGREIKERNVVARLAAGRLRREHRRRV